MAELDKKIQKAQTDLVQSVLEAQEKRNIERVEVLITNAIKQLKMSRFKPDVATCLGLTYLARICPKAFNQSSAIKEVLKSLLRRDNGPANIKSKNDIVLPVLAANILLATCISVEIKQMILHKIEQWLGGSSQKASDLIQHLLATICMKCHQDQQTVATLIEMRHHWLLYMEENSDFYGLVPVDLCINIRKLLHSDTDCSSLLVYLKFLIKHDADIEGLSKEISKFIIDRPISLNSMLKEHESGAELIRMLLKIFNKLLSYLKKQSQTKQPATTDGTTSEVQSVPKTEALAPRQNKTDFFGVIVKSEPIDPVQEHPGDNKPHVDIKASLGGEPLKRETVKNEQVFSTGSTPASKDGDESSQETSDRLLYIKLPEDSKVIALSKVILEANLILLALFDSEKEESREEFEQLLSHWRINGKINRFATIYEDLASRLTYDIPDHLRYKMVHSNNDFLIDLSLHEASVGQLLKLLHLFGSPLTTVNKILSSLEYIKDIELIKGEIKDASLFSQLLEFYMNMGASGAQGLHKRLKMNP